MDTNSRTTVQRKSDRELVIAHTFDAPARLLFDAWSKPELFKKWWVPRSAGMSLLSCKLDVRTDGRYRLEFGHGESGSMAFFGRYIEVIPNSRIVWTNEENENGAVTTVTFNEKAGKTLLVFSELYPSKKALDESIEGMEGAMPEQFAQLDELLVSLSAPEKG